MLFALGVLADLLGVFSAREIFIDKRFFSLGIDLVEGGLSPTIQCPTGICGKNTVGATNDMDFEAVVHLAAEESSGPCLAVGISVLNVSNLALENVRLSVRLEKNSPDDSNSSFCDEYSAPAHSPYPNVKLEREFSNSPSSSAANYWLSDLPPNSVAVLTVPIKKVANLKLSVSNGSIHLVGAPTKMTLEATAAGIEAESYKLSLYIENVNDISQALADHGLLWSMHCNFAVARTSCGKFTLFDLVKATLRIQPRQIEYILGFFESPTMGSDPQYSTPSQPLQKNVIASRSYFREIGLNINDYLDLKSSICNEVVKPIEGLDYQCNLNSNGTSNGTGESLGRPIDSLSP